MLVTLKNLEKETFQIDIDPSCTVKELKEKVERDKGANYAAPLQKLIYSGKILQDEEVEIGILFQTREKILKNLTSAYRFWRILIWMRKNLLCV